MFITPVAKVFSAEEASICRKEEGNQGGPSSHQGPVDASPESAAQTS